MKRTIYTIFLFILGGIFVNSCEQEELTNSPKVNSETYSSKESVVEYVTYWRGEKFVRPDGKPQLEQVVVGSDDLQHFEECFILKIKNGDELGNQRISSALIKVDGELIFSSKDFSLETGYLEKEICGLSSESKIDVVLNSEVGSFIEIWIDGVLLPGRKIIDEFGGEIVSDDGLLKITIPTGEVRKPTIFSALRSDKEMPNIVVGNLVGDTYLLTPSGMEFSTPLIVRLSFDPTLFPEPYSIGILHYNEEYSIVNMIPTWQASLSTEIEFEISHFSWIQTVESDDPWTVYDVYWGIDRIKWFINPTNDRTFLTEENVMFALKSWEKETSSFKFVRTEDKGEANIIFTESGEISWLEQQACKFQVIRDIAGLACIDLFSNLEDVLTENDFVEIRLASNAWSDGEDSMAIKTIVHEIGHALGLGHPKEGQIAFWPIMMQGLREFNGLHDWDINALGHFYELKTGENDILFNPNLNYGTMEDIEGNLYKTIKIGNQTWMAQNLRTSKYNNREPIFNVTDNEQWKDFPIGAYAKYNNDESYVGNYGYLYNGHVISETGGIAPNGWHVPTREEWEVLVDYLGGILDAGGSLMEAGISHWISPNVDATNRSGFTALPGGFRLGGTGTFDGLNGSSGWWTSSVFHDRLWSRSLSYNETFVFEQADGINSGNYIRLIKNMDTDSDGVSDHLDNCPDTPQGISVDNSGCPIIESDILFNPNLSYGSIKDINGNEYKTIQIGTQIWMAENLKTTNYSNGEDILDISNRDGWFQLSEGAYSNYDNNESNVSVYGRLYNWFAIDDKRGLCPDGWHVPNDDEWKTLMRYLGGYSVAGGKLKESGFGHWILPNEGATNSSGFTALPAGFRQYSGKYMNLGSSAYWWSSLEYDYNPTFAMAWQVIWYYPNLYTNHESKNSSNCVRCVKD